jgi:hypothetical protein
MGGGINVQTGDVSVHGAVVDHVAPCTAGWKLERPTKQKDGTVLPSGGWYAWTDAQAPSISGTTYPFDAFYSSLNIPTNPSPPSGDSPLIYLFSSLQNNEGLSSNGAGCGSNIILIQPVLQWGYNGANGGAYWSMAAWEVWGCNSDCVTNCSAGHSPYVTVTAGDSLNGTMVQTANNTDTWEVRWDDYNTSGYTWNTIYGIPSTWPKFKSLQGGVFEGHSISHCTDLSPDNSLYFYNDGAYVADTAWNSFYEVDAYGANLLSFGNNTNTFSPSCSPGSSVNSNDDSDVTWVE